MWSEILGVALLIAISVLYFWLAWILAFVYLDVARCYDWPKSRLERILPAICGAGLLFCVGGGAVTLCCALGAVWP